MYFNSINFTVVSVTFRLEDSNFTHIYNRGLAKVMQYIHISRKDVIYSFYAGEVKERFMYEYTDGDTYKVNNP